MSSQRPLVLAQVVRLQAGHVYYPCCHNCYSKLHKESNDRWQCLRCHNICSSDQVSYRYRLSLSITDGQTECAVCVFGKNLEPYFGVPASDFAGYVQHTESRVSACFDDLLQQSLSHTFAGQSFLFGFKTKPSARGTASISKDKNPVSLQTVIDCCGSGSGSEVTLLGHSQVRGQSESIVAWQMTCSSTQQQIQPVLGVLQTLVWRCQHADEQPSLRDPAEDSVDSLLCAHGNLTMSLTGGLTLNASTEQRTLMLSCEEEKDHSMMSDTRDSDDMKSPELCNNVSVEKPRVDVHTTEADQIKLGISFDRDIVGCADNNVDLADVMFDSMISGPPRTCRPPECEVHVAPEAEAVHMSDIDFDETLDVADDVADVDTAQAASCVENFVQEDGKHVPQATGGLDSDFDETLDLAPVLPEQGEVTKDSQPEEENQANRSSQNVTFTKLDETDFLAQYKQAVCDTQAQTDVLHGAQEHDDGSVSEHDDCDDSVLLLACEAQTETAVPGTGPSVKTDMLASDQDPLNTTEKVPSTEHPFPEPTSVPSVSDLSDTWSQMPESEDLSAFLEEAEVQFRKTSIGGRRDVIPICDRGGAAETKHVFSEPVTRAAVPLLATSAQPPDSKQNTDTGLHSMSSQKQQPSSADSLGLVPDFMLLEEKVETPGSTHKNISTVPPKGPTGPSSDHSANFDDDDDFPESEDLDVYLQKMSLLSVDIPVPGVKSGSVTVQEDSTGDHHTVQPKEKAEAVNGQKTETLKPCSVSTHSDACSDEHEPMSTGLQHPAMSNQTSSSSPPKEHNSVHCESEVAGRPSSKTPSSCSVTPVNSELATCTPQHSPPALCRSPTKFNLRQFAVEEQPDEAGAHTQDETGHSASFEGSADLFDSDFECSMSSNDSVFGDDVLADENISDAPAALGHISAGWFSRRRVTHISASLSSVPSKQLDADIFCQPAVPTKGVQHTRQPTVRFSHRLSTVKDIGDIDYKMLTTPSPEPNRLMKRRSCLKTKTMKTMPLTLPPNVDVESQDLFCSPVGSGWPEHEVQDRLHYQSTPVCPSHSLHCDPSDAKIDEDLHGDSSLFSDDSFVPSSCTRSTPNIPSLHAVNIASSAMLSVQVDSPDLFSQSHGSERDISLNNSASQQGIMPCSDGVGPRHRPALFRSTVLGGPESQVRLTVAHEASLILQSQDMFADSTDSLLGSSLISRDLLA